MIKCKRRFMHGKRRKRSPIKQNMLEVENIDNVDLITGTAPTTGGIGAFIDSAKTTFEGYSKTNPQIIKDARMMIGKI